MLQINRSTLIRWVAGGKIQAAQKLPGQNGVYLFKPAEVAHLFRVDPKTVTRWAKAGRLSSIRTLGGHRRYLEAEVEALMRPQTLPYQPISGGHQGAARRES